MLLDCGDSDISAPVSEGHVWNKDTVGGGGTGLLSQLLLFSDIRLKSVEVDREKCNYGVDQFNSRQHLEDGLGILECESSSAEMAVL